MDPVGCLSSSLENISLNLPCPVQTVKTVTPLPSDGNDERVGQLFTLLRQYVCESECLDQIRQMTPREYTKLASSKLFTCDEARRIAEIAAMLLAGDNESRALVVSRKKSLLLWKIVLADSCSALLLLPKKNHFPDLVGNTKRGRVALLCRLGNKVAAWQAEIIWNLTVNKNKAPTFSEARKIEAKLCSVVGKSFFPACYYDFSKKYNDIATRSCYYEKHQCLFYWSLWQPIELLQKVALEAAKKVAALHQNEVVVVDLKSENLLVTKELDVLICDVDQMLIDQYQREPTDGGTILYYPPELLVYKLTEGKSADVFAFGCMLLEMLTGLGPPWQARRSGRKSDTATLDKYRAVANRAKIFLESGEAMSSKKMMFLLAQWALNPRREMRPDMNTICRYLERKYDVQDDLVQAEIDKYLDIEK